MPITGYLSRNSMTPIFVLLMLLIALVILGGTGAAPFIYTLF